MDGRSFALGACQYPGIVTPRGFELLEEFRPEPCATWVYGLGGIRLEKQVYLVEGTQAVVIRYRADRALTLRVRPFLADRDYHSLQHAGNWSSTALQFHSTAKLIEEPHWYYNVEYLEELDRGLDFREDLYSPGVFVLDLKPGEWTPICGSADGTNPRWRAPRQARSFRGAPHRWKSHHHRRLSLVHRLGPRYDDQPPGPVDHAKDVSRKPGKSSKASSIGAIGASSRIVFPMPEKPPNTTQRTQRCGCFKPCVRGSKLGRRPAETGRSSPTSSIPPRRTSWTGTAAEPGMESASIQPITSSAPADRARSLPGWTRRPATGW